jgi:hypothetical protein
MDAHWALFEIPFFIFLRFVPIQVLMGNLSLT